MEQCPTAAARRRRFGRGGRRPGGRSPADDRQPLPTLDDPLAVTVQQDGRLEATIVVTGLLLRQHAARLDERLAAAFCEWRTRYVIDLGGVTCLDPTTLAAVTRYADHARGLGARVTIVPPGVRRPVAA